MRCLTLYLALAVVLISGSPADWLKRCGAKPALNSRQPAAGQQAAVQPQPAGIITPHEPSQRVTRRPEEGSARLHVAPSLNPTLVAGNRFATRVLAMLERRSSVVARVRHRVHLGECALLGSGRYWQQGVGNLRKTRLVLQTQVANQSASLVQVFDGRYLWTDQQFPSGRTVTRLDPVRLQEGLAGGESPIARQGRPTAATSLLSAAASRGSLCGQLADLVKQFDFKAPRQVPWNGTSVAALIGQWKADQLERAWSSRGGSSRSEDHSEPIRSRPEEKPTQKELAKWPKQLPHHVLMLVGSHDLHPYVIEYRRSGDDQLASSPKGLLPAADPLARFEQFDVQFAAQIDDRLFELASRDIQWTDETGRLIKQMQAWEQ